MNKKECLNKLDNLYNRLKTIRNMPHHLISSINNEIKELNTKLKTLNEL